jgi:hypothetical protein
MKFKALFLSLTLSPILVFAQVPAQQPDQIRPPKQGQGAKPAIPPTPPSGKPTPPAQVQPPQLNPMKPGTEPVRGQQPKKPPQFQN